MKTDGAGGTREREPKKAVSSKKKQEIAKCLACTRRDCEGHCPVGRPLLPVPEDFVARVRRGERVKDLSKAYRVSYGTVTRWRKVTGLAGKRAGKPQKKAAHGAGTSEGGM